ncbi:olfactory receptor 14A16-like [Ornithorhynchus anatinus]|uniref:olfactory receptor 14A16-like n=1 Tax=Ornithorhynchus anatinus TaxID=9258 RepID=UPI0010A8A9BD|nr:olfactory receptor 14A16-like [Ornithorhynchus anatinus]
MPKGLPPDAANISTVREFLLLGFSEVREVRLVQAALFLLVYLAALTGNLLVVAVTVLDRRLRAPMYFFLGHLSVLDLCLVSVTVPQSVHNALTDRRSISFLGCAAQLYFFACFASLEIALLTAMSYDRYVAICLPLRYEVIMDRGACGKMAAASWLGGVLSGLVHAVNIFLSPFCASNVIRHFFCDIPQLLTLSCSPSVVPELVLIGVSVTLDFGCFLFMGVSYFHIFSTVLRIPSAQNRTRAFSTCLPHLAVITIFLSTGFFSHLKPTSDGPTAPDLPVSAFYTVVPPALNPLIYSLRNRDIKAALRKFLRGKLF